MKSSRPLLLSRPAVIIALIIGFSLVTGTALLSTFSTREMAAASTRIGHAQTTVLEINQLLAILVNAEAGQRGYILTGLEEYLAPYEGVAGRAKNQIARLRASMADSPVQLAKLDAIEKLADEKIAGMARTIELRHSDASAALNAVVSGKGLALMNALRSQLDALEQHELSELNIRSSQAADRSRQFQIASLVMIAVAFVHALVGMRMIMGRMHELESLITVCAWTNRVKYQGQWISFEHYLHQRFNLNFTHSISEEAAGKLMLDELDLNPDIGSQTASRDKKA